MSHSPRLVAGITQLETRPAYGTRVFKYSSRESRKPGAFRAIKSSPLLFHGSKQPELQIWEWPELCFNEPGNEKSNYPLFVAISHVWYMTPHVTNLMKQEDDILIVETMDKHVVNGHTTRKLSWEVLRTVARAGLADWIWLDLFCMDEVDKPNPYGSGTDMEKDYQIKNMANIYRWCDAVCILVGGLGAVQTVDIASHYINRAWTLEESTINLNDNIWAIVKWPYPTTFTITSLTPNLSVNFINVHGQFYRIPFKTLLNFPRVLQGYTIPPISFPNNFKVRCLNGIEKSKMKRTAKVALRYYYSKYNKTGRSAEHARRAAIWRSMLLRTVSNPNDVVYSVEGIISADDPVDPDRDHRTVQELFNDLALKAAARGRPDWLSIGPVYGSPIPRDTESRLIYRVPTYPPHQHTPYYKKGNGSKVYTGDLIGQEQGYIRLYNIKFISISVPHLVCAVIIKVKNATSPKSMLNTPEGNRYKFQMNVSGVGSRQCVYSGKPSGTALLIGLVGSFNNNGQSIYKGNTAIIFIKRKNYEWIVTGNGCYDISQASWPNGKVHLRIGKGAKSKGKPTKCDCNSGTSNKKLHSSWGIVPIADFIQTGSSRPIIWVGKKGQQVKTNRLHFERLNVWHNPSAPDLVRTALVPPGLWVPPPKANLMMIRYNSPNPPTYLHELDWSKAIIAARIVVEYSDVNFGPQIQSSPEAAQRSYEAAIQFRKNSVYFLMRKDDTTQLEYYHMSSSSYRKKDIWRSKKDKNSGLNSTGMAYCKYVPGYAYCK